MPVINQKWEPFYDYRILKVGDIVRHTKEYLEWGKFPPWPDPTPEYKRKTPMVVVEIGRRFEFLEYNMKNKYVYSSVAVSEDSGQTPFNRDNFCDLERRM